MKKTWSKKEISFLRENYLDLDIEEICSRLDRTRQSISSKALRLGLKKISCLELLIREGHFNSSRQIKQSGPYISWSNMKSRCNNKKSLDYKYYGGKGILVCKEWNKFSTFYKWSINNGWLEGLTIDRLNNNLGYFPDNCKWSSRSDQVRNTSNNVNITAFNETMCAVDWAKDFRCPISVKTLYKRISRGWNAEKAITEPSKRCASNI